MVIEVGKFETVIYIIPASDSYNGGGIEEQGQETIEIQVLQ